MAIRSIVSLIVAALVGIGCLPGAATPTAAPTKPVAPSPPAPASPAAKPSPPPSPVVLPSPSPSPSPSPEPLTRIRLAAAAPSLGGWAIEVADQNGYFQAQRLAIEEVREEPGKLADALNARAADIALAPTEMIVRGTRSGQSLVMVAGAVNRAAFSLIAARDVPDFGALKGKLIAVRDPKDSSAAILKRILRARGVGEQDVRLIGFEDGGTRAAAVANGTVGAALLEAGPAARLEASGFAVLTRAADVVPNFQAEVLAVRADWARQNEQTLVRFLRAIIQADRWINAPANNREAIDILAGVLKLTTVEAGRVYDYHVDRLSAIPREGELEQPGVRAVLELMAEIDALRPPLPDPARLTDTSYLLRAR